MGSRALWAKTPESTPCQFPRFAATQRAAADGKGTASPSVADREGDIVVLDQRDVAEAEPLAGAGDREHCRSALQNLPRSWGQSGSRPETSRSTAARRTGFCWSERGRNRS